MEAVGYTNKKERDDVLLELYRQTYHLIDARLRKAQSQKSAKSKRNRIELTVYMNQLKEMLIEGKYKAKNTIKFAKQLEKLVSEITAESKLQKKILNKYWKEKYGKTFNTKEIALQSQTKLFE